MEHSRSLLGALVAVPPTPAGYGAGDTTGTTASVSASDQTVTFPAATRVTPGELYEGVKTPTELAGKDLGSIIPIRGDDERAAKTGIPGTAIRPSLEKRREFGALSSTAVPLIKNRKNPGRFGSASASPLKRTRGRGSVERCLARKEVTDGFSTGFCR